MGDDDQPLTVLYDHYKDTFATIRDRERERDRLYLILVALLGLLGVQIGYPADAGGLLSEISAGGATIAVSALPAAAVLTATWTITFVIALRYATRATTVRRQYRYLHTLEADVANRIAAPDVFRREGQAYLQDRPVFWHWTSISYVLIFPIAVIVSAAGLLTVELTQLAYPLLHKLFDTAVAAAIIATMYLYRLHPPHQAVQRLRRLITRQ